MKCKKCGIGLSKGKNRIFSKAENGLCGFCVDEVNQSQTLKIEAQRGELK